MDQPESDTGTRFVRVTNRNNFMIEDFYDGVPFRFKPNEPVTMPADAAAHILGWPGNPDQIMSHVQRRWGWNTPAFTADNLYKKLFQNLEIKPVVARLVEIDEETEQAPSPAAKPANERGAGKRDKSPAT